MSILLDVVIKDNSTLGFLGNDPRRKVLALLSFGRGVCRENQDIQSHFKVNY